MGPTFVTGQPISVRYPHVLHQILLNSGVALTLLTFEELAVSHGLSGAHLCNTPAYFRALSSCASSDPPSEMHLHCPHLSCVKANGQESEPVFVGRLY